MNRKLSEFQVGALTILAVIALIVGMMWLKNINLMSDGDLYQVDFAQVEGMRAGDKVLVRGIRMGEVAALHILSDAVRVEIVLDDYSVLCADATFTLSEKGIVGDVVIEVDPGTGEKVQEGHIFKGRNAGTIAAMTDAASEALAEARRLTATVGELVAEVKSRGMVIETLQLAHATLDTVDRMVKRDHVALTNILDNMNVITLKLRELMESGQIEHALEATAGAMGAADTVMVALSETSRRLDQILQRLEGTDSTAGLLLNDPGLYTTADSTMHSLKRLIDAMRRNPKRYLKLNVIDF